MDGFFKLAIHSFPDLDSVVAGRFLQLEGDEKFPGISLTEPIFWSEGISPDGRTSEDWALDRVIAVDVGRGYFDHHPHRDINPAWEEDGTECAVDQVVKYLGLTENPSATRIADFVRKVDRKGKTSPANDAIEQGLAGLSRILGYANNLNPKDPAKVFEIGASYFDIIWYGANQYSLGELREQLAKGKQIELENGMKVFAVISDHPRISSFAKSSLGCDATVAVQKTTRGNVLITGKMNLDDVASIIRVREAEEKRVQLDLESFAPLRAEGNLEGVEEWYYLGGKMLLNGSKKVKVTPTILPWKTILWAVCEGIDQSKFPIDCPPNKCFGRRCQSHKYGLARCRRKRGGLRKNEAVPQVSK